MNLPEFEVSVTLARKTGPLHADVEYRTFITRVPAVDAEKAKEAGYGLGHGINDASGHAWKFVPGEAIKVEPAGRCRNCAPGYDCESGIYTSEQSRG